MKTFSFRAHAPVAKPKLRRAFVLSGLFALVAACQGVFAAAGAIREPAVAKLFYPGSATELGATVDRLLAAAQDPHLGRVRALIVPHAGYEYSGPVAASAYRSLQSSAFERVIVMGPAHTALLNAASVSDATAYRTPLGDVPIAPLARTLAQEPPFQLHAPARVERPEWASAGASGSAGSATAETWEHSIEVELPFLQRTLRNFSLVPVVFGDVDAERAAVALSHVWDETTLVVASSDLSHYHPYAEAKALDRTFIDAVLQLDIRRAANGEACGLTPVLTLLHLARAKQWRPVLLDLRNSGDTAGDKSRVVGYAAIAFVDASSAPSAAGLTANDRAYLLRLARQSVERAVQSRRETSPARNEGSPAVRQQRACFVTLTEKGELRGCIGTLVADEPLDRMVADAAASAAVRDPRFPPVTAAELPRLHIEVSVLTEPQPLAFKSPEELLQKLRPGVDGVLLTIGNQQATYLPQVWKEIADKEAFLDSLAEKAGAAPKAWRGKNVSVKTYQVESFEEEK